MLFADKPESRHNRHQGIKYAGLLTPHLLLLLLQCDDRGN
jgi:hypothetical protein